MRPDAHFCIVLAFSCIYSAATQENAGAGIPQTAAFFLSLEPVFVMLPHSEENLRGLPGDYMLVREFLPPEERVDD